MIHHLLGTQLIKQSQQLIGLFLREKMYGNKRSSYLGFSKNKTRTDAEAETSTLWPPDAESWLIWKDPDAGKDWGQEKGMKEDEMVWWHHRLNGHGFGWTPGVGDRQGGLVCYGSWGSKESDTTEWLNWTEKQNNSLS